MVVVDSPDSTLPLAREPDWLDVRIEPQPSLRLPERAVVASIPDFGTHGICDLSRQVQVVHVVEERSPGPPIELNAFGTEECAWRMNTWAAVFQSEGNAFGTEECAWRMNTWAAVFQSEGCYRPSGLDLG